MDGMSSNAIERELSHIECVEWMDKEEALIDSDLDSILDVESLLGILNANKKNPQAHGYRCSFHPGVFQSIDFPQRT